MNGHEPISPVSFHSCHQVFILSRINKSSIRRERNHFFVVILDRQVSFFFEDFIDSILQRLSPSATISAHLQQISNHRGWFAFERKDEDKKNMNVKNLKKNLNKEMSDVIYIRPIKFKFKTNVRY